MTTKHLGEGIAADYDADGKLAGIEILDAIKRFGGKETLRQVVMGLGFGVGLSHLAFLPRAINLHLEIEIRRRGLVNTPNTWTIVLLKDSVGNGQRDRFRGPRRRQE